MSETVISQSNKRRYAARYTRDGKQRNSDYPMHFEMAVVKVPTGKKKKNGKPAIQSYTSHRRV